MAFLKRLGFYIIGLAIGLIFLTYFLKGKADEAGVEFCYFPNCRVLKDIRSKTLAYAPVVQDLIDRQQLDATTIAYFLKDGTINFRKSDTQSQPCKTYVIEGNSKGTDAFMEVVNCDSIATIQHFSSSR
ncbi:DUF4258 domain-containing protein [Arenibacter sp. GZD96]|uniref:hypothetical protein n=1 Tax=Aurantibrevibacter litoralis TaxID=3106030 RepID=UPI002AFEE074|nr:hypothetical protein [Arenibacter sp. GZD-96]MEA1785381.1 DUF4258 domain-containing protein [Arenibacter sp. GZD-96]